MTAGSAIYASSDIAFFKMRDDSYRVSVAASKKKGGEVYLNPDLMKLVLEKKFEKIGTQMTAFLPMSNLEKFLGVLQDQLGVTISINQNLFDSVGITSEKKKRKINIELPPPELPQNEVKRKMQLRAKALQLKLALLSF